MSMEELTFAEKTGKKSYLYKNDTKLFRTEGINIDKIELSKEKKMTKKRSKKYRIYNT